MSSNDQLQTKIVQNCNLQINFFLNNRIRIQVSINKDQIRPGSNYRHVSTAIKRLLTKFSQNKQRKIKNTRRLVQRRRLATQKK